MTLKQVLLLVVLVTTIAVWALDATKQSVTALTEKNSTVTATNTPISDSDTPFEITDLPTARCWYIDVKRLLCITETFDQSSETVHVSQQLYTRGNGK